MDEAIGSRSPDWLRRARSCRLQIVPEDELADEGLSLVEESEQMVARLEGVIEDDAGLVPRGADRAGVLSGIDRVSIDRRRGGAGELPDTAALAAVVTFGALLSIDIGGALAALNAGPIVREMYLWNALLWILLHLMMTIGALSSGSAVA